MSLFGPSRAELRAIISILDSSLRIQEQRVERLEAAIDLQREIIETQRTIIDRLQDDS